VLLVVLVLATACASSKPREGDVETIQHVDRVAPVVARASVPLAGARCAGLGVGEGPCRCRATATDEETDPPKPGRKRFEVRLSADGGSAVLESPGLGKFETAGPQEVCFYFDVTAGTTNQFTFTGKANKVGQGFSPRAHIAEYGPKGPFWYDIAEFHCIGANGRCDRDGARSWGEKTINQRKRGRLEPCGSAVISKLAWETAGGDAERDTGYFRDFVVRFAMEVKRFETQFKPGSTECVPK
jgi:hypothetical protein